MGLHEPPHYKGTGLSGERGREVDAGREGPSVGVRGQGHSGP